MDVRSGRYSGNGSAKSRERDSVALQEFDQRLALSPIRVQ